MKFHKEQLDLILVPSGLLIMFSYHLFLLYRCLKLPHTTVIGFENNDKKAWVEKVMQVSTKQIHGLGSPVHAIPICTTPGKESENKDIMTVLSVIAANTSAATYLASVSLTLSSLIGAWIANSKIFQSELIYGDTRPETMSVKYISLLICFLLAFACFVQSSRCFIHANYLLSIPDSDLPVEYVELAVIRGGDFWSLGLRALYFALTLLLWFFGPVPMFVASVSTVFLLHHLDTNTKPMHQHQNNGKQLSGRGERRISGSPVPVEYLGLVKS